MSESATLETPQAATDIGGQPGEATGTNGQAQEAIAQPGDEAKQAATESTGETPAPAEPVDMNWPEQKTAEQKAEEASPQFMQATKGLSLWQPWASLIAIGAKGIETRSWRTDFRGPIAILSTKEPRATAVTDQAVLEAMDHALTESGMKRENLPLGCIVAIADVVDCIEFSKGFDPGYSEKLFGDYSPGRFGFVFGRVQMLTEPIPCAGFQKIFELPPEAMTALNKPLSFTQTRTDQNSVASEASNPAKEEPIGSAGARHIGDPPDLEMWKLIKSAREEEKAAEEEVNLLSVEMKEAKKRHEGASARLGKLLDESDHPNLFTGQKVKPEPIENAKAPETSESACKPTKNITENIPEPSPNDESWRLVQLADLGIKPTTLKILAEHLPALTTHGELADWQQKKGDFWAKDISGVGPTKRKEIEDAQFAYWQKHPQPAKADRPDCLAGDCDTHLTAEGRDIEVVNQYASTCDLCGELTSHELMAMDQETQLGYCENCFADAKKRGLLVTNIGNDFRHLPPGPKAGVRGEASAPVTLADLGITINAVEAAYYPKLLALSKGDKPVDCPDVLTLRGSTWIHVAVPGPVGGADMQLIPLIAAKDQDAVRVDEHDRYGGIIVTHKMEKFYLGGVSQSLFISSPKAQGVADAKLTRADAKAAKMENVLA